MGSSKKDSFQSLASAASDALTMEELTLELARDRARKRLASIILVLIGCEAYYWVALVELLDFNTLSIAAEHFLYLCNTHCAVHGSHSLCIS